MLLVVASVPKSGFAAWGGSSASMGAGPSSSPASPEYGTCSPSVGAVPSGLLLQKDRPRINATCQLCDCGTQTYPDLKSFVTPHELNACRLLQLNARCAADALLMLFAQMCLAIIQQCLLGCSDNNIIDYCWACQQQICEPLFASNACEETYAGGLALGGRLLHKTGTVSAGYCIVISDLANSSHTAQVLRARE